MTVKFISAAHPFFRQSLGDRVICVTINNLKFMLRTVSTGFPGSHVPNEFTILPINIGTIRFIPTAPTAETDDVQIFWPIAKGIIGCMDHHHTAAGLHIIHKCILCFLLPGCAIIIQKHHIILTEIGVKNVRLFIQRRTNSHIHIEQSCLLQDLFVDH